MSFKDRFASSYTPANQRKRQQQMMALSTFEVEGPPPPDPFLGRSITGMWIDDVAYYWRGSSWADPMAEAAGRMTRQHLTKRALDERTFKEREQARKTRAAEQKHIEREYGEAW